MAAMDRVRILDQRTAQERDRRFLPGMGRALLLPLYDVVTGLSGVRALHERAVRIAGITPGQAVLDVGCGTGNLGLAVLAAQPDARVTGLDPDGAALRRAARKARRRHVALTLLQGYADRIPAEDASIDHVVSSLALHHLDEKERVAFAREALRVLRPTGKVTVVDFDGGLGQEAHGARPPAHGHGPAHALRHLPRLARRRVARRPGAPGNGDDGIPHLLAEAGFGDAREVAHVDHRFGAVAFVQATRPQSPGAGLLDGEDGDQPDGGRPRGRCRRGSRPPG